MRVVKIDVRMSGGNCTRSKSVYNNVNGFQIGQGMESYCS